MYIFIYQYFLLNIFINLSALFSLDNTFTSSSSVLILMTCYATFFIELPGSNDGSPINTHSGRFLPESAKSQSVTNGKFKR
jgi:hypothetical protein